MSCQLAVRRPKNNSWELERDCISRPPLQRTIALFPSRSLNKLTGKTALSEEYTYSYEVPTCLGQQFLARFHAEIVEGEIGGVAIYHPFGEFRRAKSYCHLYGAQGQRQAYLLPRATMNFVGLDMTTSDKWH
ncbi:hypothetical protein TNCV_1877221 [Trichonephila clavipes]|nr:hypothetical protein TNCV_1877221 [Trichonephila clavipes]